MRKKQLEFDLVPSEMFGLVPCRTVQLPITVRKRLERKQVIASCKKLDVILRLMLTLCALLFTKGEVVLHLSVEQPTENSSLDLLYSNIMIPVKYFTSRRSVLVEFCSSYLYRQQRYCSVLPRNISTGRWY